MSDRLTLFANIGAKKGFNEELLTDIFAMTEDTLYATFDAEVDGTLMRPRVMADTHTLPARGMGVTNVIIMIASNRPFVTAAQRDEHRKVAQRLYDEVFPELRIIVSLGTNMVADNVIAINHWMMNEDRIDAMIDSLRASRDFVTSIRELAREGGLEEQASQRPVVDMGFERLRRLPEEQQANIMSGLLGQPKIPALVASLAQGRGLD